MPKALRVWIDTRIWGLGLKAPFYSEQDPIKPLALQAKAFLAQQFEQNFICLSAQVAAELFHVLTARGRRLPKGVALNLLISLLNHERVIFRCHTKDMLVRAAAMSVGTCVHLWDFLAVLPFEDCLDRIFMMDPHFQSCKELQLAPVENPFGVWAPEGKAEP